MFLCIDIIEQMNVNNNNNKTKMENVDKKNEEKKKQWMTTCTSLWLTWNVNQVSIIGNSDGDGLATIQQTNCYFFSYE
jgi:hypothetical protein